MVQQDVSAAVVEHDLPGESAGGEQTLKSKSAKTLPKSAARTLHARASHIEYR
jgi:hypothetical protein